MSDIFDHEAPSDPDYSRVKGESQLADFVRRIWSTAEPYLQEGKADDLANQFHATFWEIYLAASLITLGLKLTPTAQRRHKQGGPDIQIGDAWVEAKVALPGNGPDKLLCESQERMETVPDDQILLRISNAITAKSQKYGIYMRTQRVLPGEPYVIAINGGGLPYMVNDTSVPRIVRGLFGIGSLVVAIEPVSRLVADEYYAHTPAITKKSGSHVPMAFFANSCSAFVSAIIWGNARVDDRSETLGRDLILIHNPHALHPVPHGWLRQGREYWVEHVIHHHDWYKET